MADETVDTAVESAPRSETTATEFPAWARIAVCGTAMRNESGKPCNRNISRPVGRRRPFTSR